MVSHVGRCRAIGDTLIKVTSAWTAGNAEEAQINRNMINIEEKSADDIEDEIIREIVTSPLPDARIREDLISFVRTLDASAGGVKRVASNIMLIIDYPLPQKYAKIVDLAAGLVSDLFKHMEKAIQNIMRGKMIENLVDKVDELENQMDAYYSDLKQGYYEIESSFQSAAALIILDHVVRDLEFCLDIGENAINLLAGLTYRR
jgi:predicted phosphate transport protein (TIGR00153 family)